MEAGKIVISATYVTYIKQESVHLHNVYIPTTEVGQCLHIYAGLLTLGFYVNNENIIGKCMIFSITLNCIPVIVYGNASDLHSLATICFNLNIQISL